MALMTVLTILRLLEVIERAVTEKSVFDVAIRLQEVEFASAVE